MPGSRRASCLLAVAVLCAPLSPLATTVSAADGASGFGNAELRERFRERIRQRLGERLQRHDADREFAPDRERGGNEDGHRGDGAFRERIRERLRERVEARLQQGGANGPSVAGFGATAAASAPATITDAGDYVVSLPHGGAARAYRVHVPASYAGRPMPLLVALHGGGGSMEHMSNDRNYGLVSKSEQAGFVVVFPNGTGALGDKLATWNAGGCCARARDRNVDDVGFIRAVVADIETRLAIDKSRVFATGMSNGGMMAYRLACEAAEVFKAIAAVGAADVTAACTPVAPISILHIHARDDDHVPVAGGAGPAAVRLAGKVADYPPLQRTILAWAGREQCQREPRRVLSTPGATCERYMGCASGAAVELCLTDSGGHSWPGGSKPRAKQPPSTAISANDIMWDFFTRAH